MSFIGSSVHPAIDVFRTTLCISDMTRFREDSNPNYSTQVHVDHACGEWEATVTATRDPAYYRSSFVCEPRQDDIRVRIKFVSVDVLGPRPVYEWKVRIYTSATYLADDRFGTPSVATSSWREPESTCIEFVLHDEKLQPRRTSSGPIKLTIQCEIAVRGREVVKRMKTKSMGKGLITDLGEVDLEGKADAWLIGHDGRVPVLKLFLVARSKTFRAMLEGETRMKESRTGEIKLEDYSKSTLEAFWKFLFQESTEGWEKDHNLAIDMAALGDYYDIPDLMKSAEQLLISMVNHRTALDIVVLTDKINLPKLEAEVVAYIMKNGGYEYDELKDLPKTALAKLVVSMLEKRGSSHKSVLSLQQEMELVNML